MLTWIIQISLISIIFIFLVHHLLLFFKSTLTVPKIKDLVNSPTQKYKNIYDTISNKNNSYTTIDLLPSSDFNSTLEFNSDFQDLNSAVEKKSMKDELKSFLKKQLNNESDNELLTSSNAFFN
jgi:flagellar basal body-associated protein FliL